MDRRAFSRLGIAGTALLALTLGLLAGSQPVALSHLLIPAVAIVVGAVFLSDETLLVVLVAASFVSRLTVSMGSLNVRPEHFAAAMLILKAVIHPIPSGGPLRRRLAPILCLLLLWNVATTLLSAPRPTMSATVLAWLALDYATLLALTGFGRHKWLALRFGSIFAIVNAFCAVIFYALAAFGGPQFGVQVDAAYGGFAAYAFSLEANILAAFLTLWGIVIAGGYSGLGRGWVAFSYLLFPCALIATQTRAAVLAYVIGVLLMTASRGLSTKITVAVAVPLLAALIAVTLPSSFAPVQSTIGKMSQIADFSSGTGKSRTANWQVAWGDLRTTQAMVLGLGTNTYGQRHVDPSRPDLNLPGYLGNLPLAVLYDTGIIGVLLFGWFIVSVLRTAYARRRSRGAVLPLCAAYLITSIATSSIWLIGTWIFIYFAVTARNEDAKVTVTGSHAERCVAD